jgi:hypothetical protein
MIKSEEGFSKESTQKTINEQLASEVKLLKESDPDKQLKEEFEIASLHDLQKYLDE